MPQDPDLPPPRKKKHLDEETAPPKKEKVTPDEEPEIPKIRQINVPSLQKQIAKLLKFSTFEPDHKYWLDTGCPQLNAALGSREKGLCYGNVIELVGINHGGKTAISLVLGGMAQRDGAAFGRVDLENSRDATWDTKLGADPSNIFDVYPKLVYGAAKKKRKADKRKTEDEDAESKTSGIPRLESGEELFAQAEKAMALLHFQGFKKQLWIVDSIAMIKTASQIDAGTGGQSMNTRTDRAVFLSDVLPMWCGLAANYNAMIILVNQVRHKIGVFFGDPYDSPGGETLRHVCKVRAKVRRLKNGRVLKNGRTIGIIGIIQNFKNKAGEGSVQDESCGFRIRWNRSPASVEFMPASEAEELLKGEK